MLFISETFCVHQYVEGKNVLLFFFFFTSFSGGQLILCF